MNTNEIRLLGEIEDQISELIRIDAIATIGTELGEEVIVA